MSRYHGAILAAGLGTRLRPLTHRLPKPLVPIAGRPLLEYGLDALARAGIERVGVNAWHLGEVLPRALTHRPETLTYVFETELQGTGGGVRGIAARCPGEPLVVSNGDALYDFELAPLLAAHEASGAIATLVLREVHEDSPFARVGVDGDGCVHRIAEVAGPDADQRRLRMGAYTGVQIVEPALIDRLPPAGPCDVLRTAYRAALDDRAPVHAAFVPTGSYWIDVGTVDRYLAAHEAVLDGRLPVPGLPGIDPDARVSDDAYISGCSAVLSGARVGAGAHLRDGVFVDRGATIAAGADLKRCVVWPGARVAGTHRDEVLLPPAA